MTVWSVELFKFSLKFKPRGSIKSQALTNFIVEKESRANIILEGPRQVVLEHSLKFNFKTSNNHIKYEALLAGLNLVLEVGVRRVLCNSDSQLMAKHIRDPFLLRYYHKVLNMLQNFDMSETKHIPKQDNTCVDMLSKLATAKTSQHRTILHKTVDSPAIDGSGVLTMETVDRE
ncbi:hypothetical protein CR513_40231, partial [Mucuna pruriens]